MNQKFKKIYRRSSLQNICSYYIIKCQISLQVQINIFIRIPYVIHYSTSSDLLPSILPKCLHQLSSAPQATPFSHDIPHQPHAGAHLISVHEKPDIFPSAVILQILPPHPSISANLIVRPIRQL